MDRRYRFLGRYQRICYVDADGHIGKNTVVGICICNLLCRNGMVCILFLLPNHLFQWCGDDFTVLNLLLNANGYPDAYSEFMSLVTCECCLCLSGQVCIRVATSFDVCDACQTVMPKSRPFGVLYVFTNPFVYLGDNEFICENREKVKMEYLPLIDISIMGMLHGVNSSFACFIIPPPAIFICLYHAGPVSPLTSTSLAISL